MTIWGKTIFLNLFVCVIYSNNGKTNPVIIGRLKYHKAPIKGKDNNTSSRQKPTLYDLYIIHVYNVRYNNLL